jgi:hypothetical protein
MRKIERSTSWLTKKARRGFQGYPFGTVAFYGPTADLATKIAVAIIPDESNQPDLLERWFSDGTDIRRDSVIGEKVSSFLRQHKTRSLRFPARANARSALKAGKVHLDCTA